MLKILSAVFALIISLMPFGEAPERKCDPVYNGTFIQSWMSSYWDEERWAEEVENMENAGIEYLILQDTANLSSDGTWQVYYPSELEVFSETECYSDVISSALNACKDSNIKVFVGLAMFDDWWVQSALTGTYKDVCFVMADMAEEISEKYEGFYGFYFTPEINNMPTMKLALNNIIDGLNVLIEKIPEDKPLMLSPYYTEYISVPMVLAAEPMWVSLVNKVNFRDGDIIAPQDAVGAQWIQENDLEKIWKMYRAAVDTSDKDLKLWANCENFTLARAKSVISGIFVPPATLNVNSVPCTIDRFVRQLDVASRYCENIITFSYNHYHSPSYVNPAFEKTYLDYIDNGFVVESEKPTAPQNLANNEGVLSWEEAEDNIGISHYIIYRNRTPSPTRRSPGHLPQRGRQGMRCVSTPQNNNLHYYTVFFAFPQALRGVILGK